MTELEALKKVAEAARGVMAQFGAKHGCSIERLQEALAALDKVPKTQGEDVWSSGRATRVDDPDFDKAARFFLFEAKDNETDSVIDGICEGLYRRHRESFHPDEVEYLVNLIAAMRKASRGGSDVKLGREWNVFVDSGGNLRSDFEAFGGKPWKNIKVREVLP